MSGPIRPEEVAARKIKNLPEQVFEVFNDLIAQDFDGHGATVDQKDVVDRLVAAGFTTKRIDDEDLCEVDAVYEASGWNVSYDKPDHGGYGSYRFTKKSGKSKRGAH
jgi:hypothetical protein